MIFSSNVQLVLSVHVVHDVFVSDVVVAALVDVFAFAHAQVTLVDVFAFPHAHVDVTLVADALAVVEEVVDAAVFAVVFADGPKMNNISFLQ